MTRPSVTLTGRDRPGVTARLFTVLAAHDLSVIDVEQVLIRGKLVLGALLACDRDPDLTAIHCGIRAVAADLGPHAEITMGSGKPARRRGQSHVTVMGCLLTPAAHRRDRRADRGRRRQHRPGGRSGRLPGYVHRTRRIRCRPHVLATRSPVNLPSRASTWRCKRRGLHRAGDAGSLSWTCTRRRSP